jgi:hypothetical protein
MLQYDCPIHSGYSLFQCPVLPIGMLAPPMATLLCIVLTVSNMILTQGLTRAGSSCGLQRFFSCVPSRSSMPVPPSEVLHISCQMSCVQLKLLAAIVLKVTSVRVLAIGHEVKRWSTVSCERRVLHMMHSKMADHLFFFLQVLYGL